MVSSCPVGRTNERERERCGPPIAGDGSPSQAGYERQRTDELGRPRPAHCAWPIMRRPGPNDNETTARFYFYRCLSQVHFQFPSSFFSKSCVAGEIPSLRLTVRALYILLRFIGWSFILCVHKAKNSRFFFSRCVFAWGEIPFRFIGFFFVRAFLFFLSKSFRFAPLSCVQFELVYFFKWFRLASLSCVQFGHHWPIPFLGTNFSFSAVFLSVCVCVWVAKFVPVSLAVATQRSFLSSFLSFARFLFAWAFLNKKTNKTKKNSFKIVSVVRSIWTIVSLFLLVWVGRYYAGSQRPLLSFPFGCT